jgi:D-sedoheptulose 7-phosphate isomerase
MTYLEEIKQICDSIDWNEVDKIFGILKCLTGRLFIVGVGGSAANASHAVNDFRKIANIEAYTPTDNVAEITARTNDSSWFDVFDQWLMTSRINNNDVLMIFSVGGGSFNTSGNLMQAINVAKLSGARVVGIVSRDGGYTKKTADACVLIPVVNERNITPHAESFQAIIWHHLANQLSGSGFFRASGIYAISGT